MTHARPVVLVTGAAGTLGRAIATALAAKGASLVLVDQAHDGLDACVAGLPPGAVLGTLAVDVGEPSAADEAVALASARAGRLDALINNAGIEGPLGPVDDLDLDAVRATFEVNVLAVFRWSAAAMRLFRGRGAGRIVNMASGAGLEGTALMSAYSASKHAVVGLTRSMAKEVAGDGVSVNAVCPGCIESPMMGRIEARLGELAGTGPASFLSAIPARRYARPAEVAEMVAWLALEAPTYVTGAALAVDGGLGA